MNETFRFQRTESAVSTVVDGVEILLDSESGNYYSLNSVASDVWRLLEKPATVPEISGRICDDYEVDPDVCTRSVEGLLDDLLKHGLVQKV